MQRDMDLIYAHIKWYAVVVNVPIEITIWYRYIVYMYS